MTSPMTESIWDIEHRLLATTENHVHSGTTPTTPDTSSTSPEGSSEPSALAMGIDLGPYFCEEQHHALLHAVLGHFPLAWAAEGIALEFGVGGGASLECISRHLPVVGFDSFQGLPEDWRPGYGKGSFARDFNEVLARTPDYCALVPGLFEDTLPDWFRHPDGLKSIKLVHIDCDLYSSTKTVLEHLPLKHMIRSRTVIVFDEFHGYPGSELHEEKAWREYAAQTGVQWDVLGHGEQSWGIQLR